MLQILHALSGREHHIYDECEYRIRLSTGFVLT